jgi:hypothetical protein
MNIISLFCVTIPSNVIAFFYHQTGIALIGQFSRTNTAEKAGANNQKIIGFLHYLGFIWGQI